MNDDEDTGLPFAIPRDTLSALAFTDGALMLLSHLWQYVETATARRDVLDLRNQLVRRNVLARESIQRSPEHRHALDVRAWRWPVPLVRMPRGR